MRIKLEGVGVVLSRGTPFQREALRGIDLEIETGRFYLLVGKNGSGKTTLLQVLGLLIKPTSGEIKIDGEDPWRDPKRFRRNIGFSFQFPENQIFEFTVRDEIGYASKNFGLDRIEERIEEAMRLLGLPVELAERSPITLSGGEKRKVAIASVIAHDPEILLLDEPFVNLDWPSRRELISFLKRWKESGKGLVVASHYIEMLRDLADEIIELESGRLSGVLLSSKRP